MSVKAEYVNNTLRIVLPLMDALQFLRGDGNPGLLEGVPVQGDPWKNGDTVTPWNEMKYTVQTKSRCASHQNPKGPHWDLGAGWAGALDMILTGWTDAPGLGKLDHYVQTLVGASAPEVSMTLGYAGTVLDTSLYLQGRPDCVYGFDPVEVKPRVSLGYDMAASCGVDAKSMALRGAVVATIANWLQKVTMLDVYAISTVSSGGRKVEIHVQVGEAASPLDRNALAFYAAHPATFRRLIFRLEELLPDAVRDAFGFNGGGYGMPVSCDEHARPDVYFGREMPKDLADAMATLKQAIAIVKRDLLGRPD